MESSDDDETELPFPALQNPNPSENYYDSPKHPRKKRPKKKRSQKHHASPAPPPMEDARGWRRGGEVMLEGYVEPVEGVGDGREEGGDGAVGRTKSLTDEDLEELKGCLDLGFGFSYDEIPELCSTLPALELCYSMSQRFLDEQQQGRAVEGSGETAESSPAPAAPIANWKISSPGDHPDEVKARLKYWAQAVACTVRLCS